MIKVENLAIVGVGLIGGSIGLACKQRQVAKQVVGVGRSSPGLKIAKQRGAIDEYVLDLESGVAQADLILLCTPVSTIVELVKKVATVSKPTAVITDAGSTKSVIVRTLERDLSAMNNYIGGHPLAGSEKHGPQFAEANLFQDRSVILTPIQQTSKEAIKTVTDFWHMLGARVEQLSPEEHDDILALTSHLPHLAASALAGILPENVAAYAATGFRDTTRIAAGDPQLWTDIFQQNRDAMLTMLTRYISQLKKFEEALQSNQQKNIEQLLVQGKKVRDALGN